MKQQIKILMTVMILLLGLPLVSANIPQEDLIFYVNFNDSTALDHATTNLGDGSVVNYVSNELGGLAANFSFAQETGLFFPSQKVIDALGEGDNILVGSRFLTTAHREGVSSSHYGGIFGIFKNANGFRSHLLLTRPSDDGLWTAISPSAGTTTPFFSIDTPHNTYEWNTVIYDISSTQTLVYLNGELVQTTDRMHTPNDDSTRMGLGTFDHATTYHGYDGYIDTVIYLNNTAENYNVSFMYNYLTGEEILEPEPQPESTDLENQNFVNSDGLSIEYDVYYTTLTQGPIVIMADSWGSDRTGRSRTTMKEMRDLGFVGIAVDTRGKLNSQGSRDAIGYECKDIYETIQRVRTTHAEYINESQGIHFAGFSAGGGKSLLCSGKYPDLFTTAWSINGVLNLTRWYETTASHPTDRAEMRERTGNSVGGGIEYHPAGFSPVSGSIENQEAYDSRDASLIGAYNTLARVSIQHAISDPRVSSQLSLDYNASWHNNNKQQPFNILTCASSSHSFTCDQQALYDWTQEYLFNQQAVPMQGHLLIGGWVKTQRFGIEFLDDVGYMGDVTYNFNSNGEFTLDVNTVSYTGPAEIFINNINPTINVYDNEVLVASINNNQLVSSNVNYNVSLESGTLTFTLPSMSPHTIQGIIPQPSVVEATKETRNTVFIALGLIAVILLAGAAFAVVKTLETGMDPATTIALITAMIGTAIILIVGFIVINQLYIIGV